MRDVLTYTVLAEPDRQRLARFAMQAVEALGGSPFSAAGALTGLLAQLRADEKGGGEPIEVVVAIRDQAVVVLWGARRVTLAPLPELPGQEQVAALAERLKAASDSADPEVLKQRNERITADLEAAKARAAEEMSRLEQNLERKKAELEHSIHQAQTDPLTGLFNRAAYDQRLAEALQRSRRQSEPMTLVLLDLDHFKQVNDTHGHQYGDQYIQRMANTMRDAVRTDVDPCFRVGGDEFAIVVFAPAGIGERVGYKVLDQMNGSVSIGVTEALPDDDVEGLVARADEALYRAKEQGRGQVATNVVAENDAIEQGVQEG